MKNSTLFLGVAVCASAYLLVGCVGDLFSIEPTADGDMGAEGPDMTEIEIGPPRFFPDIQTDLDKLGCTLAPSCHGGTQSPVLKPNPTTQADKDANYQNFVLESNAADPAMSPIVQKAMGLPTHTGGAPLQMTNPIYARWLAWISGGMPK